MICRIAVAQIATLPAYATQTIDFLSEPAPPDASEGEASSYLAPLRHQAAVARFMGEIGRAHLEDLEAKVRLIAHHCSLNKVHLLVLPEYSIPPTLLTQLLEAAKQGRYTIFAGTHVVKNNPEYLALYSKLGVLEIARDPNRYVRRAVAPILLPDGNVLARYKSTKSKWEQDLMVVDRDTTPVEVPTSGDPVKIDFRICIDALGLDAPAPAMDLLIVTAMSPRTDPFESLFSRALLNEIPCVIANSALFGGSMVRTASTVQPPTMTVLQRLDAREEALLIVDVDLDAQFQKRGSVFTPQPAAVIARKPFLFPTVPAQAELADLISRRPAHAIDSRAIKTLLARPHLPAFSREQLVMLATALDAGTATEDDVRLLLDGAVLPPDMIPFWNRCQQGLEEANSVLAELLRIEPGSRLAVDAIKRVGRAIEQTRPLSSQLAQSPALVRSESVDASAPFVNRELERSKLAALLREHRTVLVRGLPGIGKQTLVNAVLREIFPRSPVKHVHCVPGMESRQLLNELTDATGVTPEILRTLDRSGKARIHSLVLVHDFDQAYGQGAGDEALSEFLRQLSETSARVLLLTTRQLSGSLYPSVHLGRLSDEDTSRILSYYCKALGVEGEERLVASLHGYALAAKLAARLLKDGRRAGFDRLRFLKQIREEVLRILLQEVALGDSEKRAVEALSVFRRPIAPAARDALSVPGLEDAITSLEGRFLVERDGDRVFVMPLVREIAVEEWLRPSSGAAFHRAAAVFYQGQVKEGDLISRFEAREEAIYHLSAVGDFRAARDLAADWAREARSAARDLYRRRSYGKALEVCEHVLDQHPKDSEILCRAILSASRLKSWSKAERLLTQLRSTGAVPVHVLTGYGEALASAGVPSEGQALLEEAVQTYPQDAYATAALADLHLSASHMNEAKELAARALQLDDRSFRACDVSSRIARNLHNYEEAFRLARQAMEIDPRRGESAYNKALSKLRKKYQGNIPADVLGQ